jgi:hypothetical protein
MKSVLLIVPLASCMTNVRFADREILWRDPDDAPIPKPAEQVLSDNYMRYRSGIFLQAELVLGLHVTEEAKNANALDEVPDSTWWHDPRRAAKLQHRPFGPAEIARAPLPGPVGDVFTIVHGKSIGASRGVVVVDATGQKFMFKFDPPGYFGLSTATEVVAARLTGAAGWNVTSLTLVDLDPEQLVISPKATYRDLVGGRHRFTRRQLDALLKDVPRAPDGRLRASAGRWIAGESVGSFSYVGRRADDPNDFFPHEDRRDLRGFGIFAAWLNNVDCIEMQTLDSWDAGHVVHYQQDVGGSFGNNAAGPLELWMGQESYFHGWRVLAGFLSLGIWMRPWTAIEYKNERHWMIKHWPEIGWFDADHFDPKSWSPLWHNPAIDRMTARDRYWGMKRVLAFSYEEIRAAVAEGRYRPEAERRLVDVLWRRRARIARAYMDEVAPFENFAFEGDRLCFDDLALGEGLGGPRDVYLSRGVGPVDKVSDARRCAAIRPGRGYRIAELRVHRAGKRRSGPPVRVHFIDEGPSRRVIGIER